MVWNGWFSSTGTGNKPCVMLHVLCVFFITRISNYFVKSTPFPCLRFVAIYLIYGIAKQTSPSLRALVTDGTPVLDNIVCTAVLRALEGMTTQRNFVSLPRLSARVKRCMSYIDNTNYSATLCSKRLFGLVVVMRIPRYIAPWLRLTWRIAKNGLSTVNSCWLG